MTVFGKEYSNSYDSLYQEQNYEHECDVIESAIKAHSAIPVADILDLGCGTGNHAKVLTERGYRVFGVDLSEPMLAIARTKVPKGTFEQSDVSSFKTHRKFDAVIMMGAVLGYQVSNANIIKTLRVVRNHLKEGGIFFCDVWYGPAILSQKPMDKLRISPTRDGKIIRSSHGFLDAYHGIVRVHFDVITIDKNQIVSETEENHTMRYFFPKELELMFKMADMEIASTSSFPNPAEPVSEKIRDIGVVGK